MGKSKYCFGKPEKLCDFLCDFATSLKGDSQSNWCLMEWYKETLFTYTFSTLPILHLPWMFPSHITTKQLTFLTSSYIFLISLRHFYDESSLPGTYTNSLRFTWTLSYSHCFVDCGFGKHVRGLVFLALYLDRQIALFATIIFSIQICI